MSKRILIIGGCGYIGSALYTKLISEVEIKDVITYPKYTVDTCDLEWFGNVVNPKNINMDMRALTPDLLALYDVVILLAGHSSVAMAANSKGISAFKNNVDNFMGLLPKLKGGTKFIYAGSASVYNGLDGSSTEDMDLKNPKQLYDLTKQEIDYYMQLNLYPEIEYYSLRMATVCGISPNMRIDTMINMMVNTALEKGEIHLLNGHLRRPLLSIWNLMRDIIKIIDTEEDRRGIYNLACHNVSIEEVAQNVVEITGAKLIHSDATKFASLIGGKLPPPLDFSINSEKFQKTFWSDVIWCPRIEKTIKSTMDGMKTVLLKSTRAVGKDYE